MNKHNTVGAGKSQTNPKPFGFDFATFEQHWLPSGSLVKSSTATQHLNVPSPPAHWSVQLPVIVLIFSNTQHVDTPGIHAISVGFTAKFKNKSNG